MLLTFPRAAFSAWSCEHWTGRPETSTNCRTSISGSPVCCRCYMIAEIKEINTVRFPSNHVLLPSFLSSRKCPLNSSTAFRLLLLNIAISWIRPLTEWYSSTAAYYFIHEDNPKRDTRSRQTLIVSTDTARELSDKFRGGWSCFFLFPLPLLLLSEENINQNGALTCKLRVELVLLVD